MSHDQKPLCVALDDVPLCCSVWNREGSSLDCNAAALRLFGLSSKQSWREHYAALSPPRQPAGEDSASLLLTHLHNAFVQGRTEFDWQHCRLDGQVIPTRVTLKRVCHGGDEWVVAYAVEQPLPSHSISGLGELMLDNVPCGCMIWRAEGELIDCNREVLRWLGLGSKQELLGRVAEFWPECQPDGGRSADRCRQLMGQALQSGRVTTQWLQKVKDGRLIPCDVTLVRVMPGDEPMVAVFIRDLSEATRLAIEKGAAEERVQLMLDATPLGCTLWDEASRLVDCNETVVRLFGLSSKQAFMDRFFELSPERQPDGRLTADAVPQHIQLAHREGYVRFEWQHQTLDGTPLPAEITLVRMPSAKGDVIAAYLRDLREEHQLAAEKRAANEYTLLMLDAMPLSCSLWNEAGEIIACNQETLTLFGLVSKQAFIERFYELSPEVQPCGGRSREQAREYINIAFREGETQFEWMHQTLAGEPMPTDIILRRVVHGNGHIVACYARDLREHKESVASLKRLELLAYTDKLTCVANRHYFMEQAAATLGRLSPGGSAGLLILDIDHFKTINDTWGHLAGDVVLQSVADRIKTVMRPDDLFARYGGEEFVILLGRASLATTLSFAERVRETIAQHVVAFEGQFIKLTLSIGVVCCGYPALSLQELFSQADAALYKAKDRGRNRVEHILPVRMFIRTYP